MSGLHQRALAGLIIALECALSDEGMRSLMRCQCGTATHEDLEDLLEIPAVRDFFEECAGGT